MKKNEILILETLKKEFSENKERYSETIKSQSRTINYCKSLIQCLERKDLHFKRDSIGHFIYQGGLNYYRAEPLVGTYQALIGSGDLKVLRNETLKSRV